MSATDRPTAWWLETLRRRAERRGADPEELGVPVTFTDPGERTAAVKFFNAAYRAEEAGLTQAHALAARFAELDPELAETLRLYGEEEGWHRELLTDFLSHLGGTVQPMGRVTRLLYRAYGRARRMETILLTNLMFETIGSTTYRMALSRVEHDAARAMLTILTRDEAFHVPLNVHFLRRALQGASFSTRLRLRVVYEALFAVLVALPLASRPKSARFDRLGTLELARGYARELARVFDGDPSLALPAPRWVGLLTGDGATRPRPDEPVTSADAAERAAEREAVRVEPL